MANESLAAINSLLHRRCPAVKLLADLRSAGCQVRASGGTLHVQGPIPARLRDQIPQNKAAILALLEPPPGEWDQDEVDQLAGVLVRRLHEAWDRVEPDRMAKINALADVFDAAGLARNLGRVREIATEMIGLFDQVPVVLGKATWCERPADLDLWTGWLKTGKRWSAVVRDCPDRDDCENWLLDYSKTCGRQNVDVVVLRSGESPKGRKGK